MQTGGIVAVADRWQGWDYEMCGVLAPMIPYVTPDGAHKMCNPGMLHAM